jgi:hypothetical protein
MYGAAGGVLRVGTEPWPRPGGLPVSPEWQHYPPEHQPGQLDAERAGYVSQEMGWGGVPCSGILRWAGPCKPVCVFVCVCARADGKYHPSEQRDYAKLYLDSALKTCVVLSFMQAVHV